MLCTSYPAAADRNRPDAELAKARLALMLAAVAGFVDAVGYVVLRRLFVAHMSGNTAKRGVALGHGDLGAAVPLAVAPGLFVAGVAVGSVVCELAARRSARSPAALALLLQAALLAGFMAYGVRVVHHHAVADHSLGGFYALAALAILAMGVQAATITQVSGRAVRTTYVSGVLTALAQESVNAATREPRGRSFLRDEIGLGSRADSRGRALLLLSLWFVYLGGAVGGAFAEHRGSLWTLAFPLAALLVAAAVAWGRRLPRP